MPFLWIQVYWSDPCDEDTNTIFNFDKANVWFSKNCMLAKSHLDIAHIIGSY